MKRILLILLSIITIGVYAQTTSPTNIKWVKTDKITARTDTVVIDSVLKVRNGLRVGNEYSLPTTDGSNGQAIITNGSGVLTFGTIDVSTKQNLTDTTTYDATKYYVRTDTSHVTSTGADVKYGTLQITGQTTLNSGANSFTLPTTRGTSGYYLKTDGAGTTSWDAVSGGFKWLVTGGGTDKIYTAVQAASAGDVVIVDAGAYTETQNLAKDGVRLHFMNGAVVTNTTSAALFDITGFVNDFIVTGDATFVLTNRLVYTSSATTNNPYIEYYKASNTATNLIDFGVNLTGSLVLNGKYLTTSSGGSFLVNNGVGSMTILGGDYTTTAGYGAQITTVGNINIRAKSFQTSHATLASLYINPAGGTSTITNPNIVNIYCDLRGTYALYIQVISANSTKPTLITINGNIKGNITQGNLANNINLTFNGVVSNCTYTEAVTHSVVGNTVFNGNIHNSTLNISFNNTIINGDIHTTKVNVSNYNVYVNGEWYYDGSGASNTKISDITSTGTMYINGVVYMPHTGNNTNNRLPYLYVNGGSLVVNGIINGYGDIRTVSAYVTTSAVVMNAGKLTLRGKIITGDQTIGSGSIYRCIEITGNSTLIHSGGELIGTTETIYNAASTLTIKNYNSYFSNIARSGAGTYTETITGGGTEIVDTDVE